MGDILPYLVAGAFIVVGAVFALRRKVVLNVGGLYNGEATQERATKVEILGRPAVLIGLVLLGVGVLVLLDAML